VRQVSYGGWFSAVIGRQAVRDAKQDAHLSKIRKNIINQTQHQVRPCDAAKQNQSVRRDESKRLNSGLIIINQSEQ
jgi:hypothetical protein